MFQLTVEEATSLRSQFCDLKTGARRTSKISPLCFHGTRSGNAAELERKIEKHDGEIKGVFDAIRQLMNPVEAKRKKIGFEVREKQARYGKKDK